jgi:hypothetical protein
MILTLHELTLAYNGSGKRRILSVVLWLQTLALLRSQLTDVLPSSLHAWRESEDGAGPACPLPHSPFSTTTFVCRLTSLVALDA